MLRLVFLDPPFAERVCHLSAEKTAVGRDASNALVISDSSVSSHHCEILYWGTEIIIRDLNSRNGTLVNGVRLRGQQAPVTTGAIVEFGTVKTRLELDAPQESDTVTDFTAAHAFVRYNRTVGEQAAAPQPAESPAPGHSRLPVTPPASPGQAPMGGREVMDKTWLRRALWIALIAAAALALVGWLLAHRTV